MLARPWSHHPQKDWGGKKQANKKKTAGSSGLGQSQQLVGSHSTVGVVGD
jgi:hypothetical protein